MASNDTNTHIYRETYIHHNAALCHHCTHPVYWVPACNYTYTYIGMDTKQRFSISPLHIPCKLLPGLQLDPYIYIYIYICICVYTYICICVYTYMSSYIYICECILTTTWLLMHRYAHPVHWSRPATSNIHIYTQPSTSSIHAQYKLVPDERRLHRHICLQRKIRRRPTPCIQNCINLLTHIPDTHIVHTCTYMTCAYVHIYVHIHIHVYNYTYMHIYTHTPARAYMRMYVYIYTYTYMCAYTCTYTYTFMYMLRV